MNFFRKRALKKEMHAVRHVLRHAIAMREDIAPPADVQKARDAEAALAAALAAAWKTRDAAQLEAAQQTALAAAHKLMPPQSFPKLRENVEVLVVAISLALACKCFFLQPFKIPTGSMQPTLNGIIAYPQTGKTKLDYFPVNLLRIAVFGEYYKEVYAKVSGTLTDIRRYQDQQACYIAGVPHPIHMTMEPGHPGGYNPAKSMTLHALPGDYVKKGDLIASGRVVRGDQVFVNKVQYHFMRPNRGQIIVFETDHIPNGERFGIPGGTFYIKRLVGLPGETVGIQPPYLMVDGQPVTQPSVFDRQVNGGAEYRGYITPPDAWLNNPLAMLKVGDKEFLPFGDNTYSSLDGRYFGPVEEQALVGPAFFVYWPFGPHWGFVR